MQDMKVVFVHGWSVTDTGAYGGVPEALLKNAPNGRRLDIAHLFLGKYVSFADEVNIDDIARGMEQALREEVLPKLAAGERFACITHSTGAPVVRKWIDLFHRGALADCPISHLVMLAPANHGSALAQLGKGKLARMKFFAQKVQPGTGVLDWLELGSDQSWELNVSWLEYSYASNGFYPFVLTGQRIDRKLYDNLNSYTDEAGSDGVVRVAAANMNYGIVRLVQQAESLILEKESPADRCALGVLPGLSHTGKRMGIMDSVPSDDDASHPTVAWLLRCLQVGSVDEYKTLTNELSDLTAQTQSDEKEEKVNGIFAFERTFVTRRYCMLVFRIVDDRGNCLSDYDVYFTAGPNYDPNHLPPGFFVDRQKNQLNPGKLTYYINYDVMMEGLARPELNNCFGFRIVGRPAQGGFAYYQSVTFEGKIADLEKYFEPNQTLMVEIKLQRHVDTGVFRFASSLKKESVNRKPLGDDVA